MEQVGTMYALLLLLFPQWTWHGAVVRGWEAFVLLCIYLSDVFIELRGTSTVKPISG